MSCLLTDSTLSAVMASSTRGLQWTNHFCYVIVIEKNESATGINALVMDYKLQFGFIYRNIVSRVDC